MKLRMDISLLSTNDIAQAEQRGFMKRLSARILTLLCLLTLPVMSAVAQQLAITPGTSLSAMGDGSYGDPSPYNYAGPMSGYEPGTSNLSGTVVDTQGNLYFFDGAVHVIPSGKGAVPVLSNSKEPNYLANPQAGNIYLVAGNGTSSPSSGCTGTTPLGDGCYAAQAALPQSGDVGMTMDAQGNIYLADAPDNEVRVIYAAGSIVGLPSNPEVGRIYAIAGDGTAGSDGDGGAALSAQLNGPASVAVDGSGNVYIADTSNQAVRVLYAGKGNVPGLPEGAQAGNLYTITGVLGTKCSDTDSTGSSPCGDGQIASQAQLNTPQGIALDGAGNLYIADQYDYRLRAVYLGGSLPGISNPTAGNIYTVAGTGTTSNLGGQTAVPATSLSIQPVGVTVDAGGNVYIANPINGGPFVNRIDVSGAMTEIMGSGSTSTPNCATATSVYTNDGCPSYDAIIYQLYGVMVDSNNNLYVVDNQGPVIHRLDVSTSALGFAEVIGFPNYQPVYAYNTSATPVNISGIDFTGSFAQASTGSADCASGSQLAPGTTCTVQVAYNATQPGSDAGTVTLASDSLNGADTVQLTGTATQSTSSTVLAVSGTLVGVGQPVTLTATVSAPYGSNLVPTGTVSFQNGKTVLGTASLSGGTATFTASNLPAGSNAVFASYGGDANFSASASYAHAVTVSSIPISAVTLTSSATTVNAGASVSLTATVASASTGAIPTGTISFQDGAAVLGTATLNGGTATFSTSTLPAGSNTLYAAYSGDPANSAQISNGVSVSVTTASRMELIPGIISTFRALGSDNTRALAIDHYGSIYYNFSVTASGNGPIPGVANPVAGTTYKLLGGTCSVDGTVSCGIPGPASGANLENIGEVLSGMQVDTAGNVYILDANHLYRIDATTDYVTDVTPQPVPAANGSSASSPAFKSLSGFFLDNGNNLYIADSIGYLVFRQDALTSVLSVVAGTGTGCSLIYGVPSSGVCGDGGPATAAPLLGPGDVYLDAAGNLFILDGSASVRKVDAKTGLITTVAGSETRQTCSVVAFSPGSAQCGDGGPATSAFLSNPSQIIGDEGGNLYIADAGNGSVRKVDASGTIYDIAGITRDSSTVYAGDGIPATNANLYQPSFLALDPQGNLYIADQQEHLFQVTAGTGLFTFAAADAGPGGTQVLTLSNTGSSMLDITGLTFSSEFVQQPTGGTTDCTGTDTLAPGFSCQIGVAFFPGSSGQTSGSLNIADDSINAVNGQNIVTLSGTPPAGIQANTISFAALPNVSYGAAPITLSATASSGNPVAYAASGPAALSGNTLTITGAGQVTVTAYQVGDGTYAPATPVSQSFSVNPVTVTVTANSFSCQAGQITSCLASNSLTYATTGFVNGDTSAVVSGTATLTTTVTSTSPAGAYPISFTTENLKAANYTFSYVPGTLTVAGNETQSITFASLPNVTYGAAAINLSATASSGLPVSYAVSGPATLSGSILTLTGAGAVTVTAQQAGNATFAAAAPVLQSFVVNKAVLTVTADNQTMAQGNSPQPFTATITGFVNGDSSSAVTGSPAFTSNASSNSPLGAIPLIVSQGTLAANNYSFTFVNGTITVVAGTAQTISFTAIPALAYGIGPVSLQATSSAGLPISFTVSGPARLTGNVLNVTGAGIVKVTATQAGGGVYSAAPPVSQSITVAPAVLTIVGDNLTRVNNVPNPPLTYTLTGFVNGDTASVVGGNVVGTTTATPGSPVGTYPVQFATGGLTAVNYIFTTQPGTLTITSGGLAPDFSISAAPQVLTMAPGQMRQTTLTLTPVNYFQGAVALNCGTLPANMSCIFTPASFNADGTGAPVSVTLTVNTDGSSPVIGALTTRHPGGIVEARLFWLPAVLIGLVLAFYRRKLATQAGLRSTLMLIMFLCGGLSVVGCAAHGSSATTQYASPGTTTVAVTSTGTPSNGTETDTHTLNLTVTVQGLQ